VEDGEDHQHALAGVWMAASRILSLGGPSDTLLDKKENLSLYQLGIDSINVMPFAKLIGKSESIRLSPDAVLKARTIRGVARLVQETKRKSGPRINGNICANDAIRQKSEARHEDVAIDETDAEKIYDKTLQRVARELMFVATPLQESMLSASLAVADRAYTYVHTIQLSDDALEADTPNLDRFFAAVGDTVQACEILRTRFVFTQDEEAPWVGFVSPAEQSDLASWERVDSGPPGRINLRIHHSLYDAASIRAVWRILRASYARRLRARDPCPGSPTQHLFRPFARAVASAQKMSVAFWTDLVQGYSYTPLNLGGESLQARSAIRFALSEHELSLLQARCRALGVTTKAALQLVWAKVLCESLYGQADIVFGDLVSTGGELGSMDVVGPTINTVPMRVKLAERGENSDVAEALIRIQRITDDAKGTAAMGSLRKIQAIWRSSSRYPAQMPTMLFQSLFVFDGVVDLAKTEGNEPLFGPAHGQGQSDEVDGPAYDDAPLIASFRITNNALHGKLRAKMVEADMEALGGCLHAALRWILSCEMADSVLDLGQMNAVGKSRVASKVRTTEGTICLSDENGRNPMALSILAVARTVLGQRCRHRDVEYSTRLADVGLDSILAIRLSGLLKRQLGVTASVFHLTKGASIRDIVEGATPAQESRPQIAVRQSSSRGEALKKSAAEALRVPQDFINAVLPVLPGQRAHLEQWLHNGKRFFEAPWVYRIDNSFDAQSASRCWVGLCRVHGALRTTFLCTSAELVQVTLGGPYTGEEQFTAVRDLTVSIQNLIHRHVSEKNGEPSDFRTPPARLSFLEASNGKAIVLRLHHALYDAWSIKMIETDLRDILAYGKVAENRVTFEDAVQEILDIRQAEAEGSYWKRHVSGAQDTILSLHEQAEDGASHISPLGSHFKARYSSVISQSAINAAWRTHGGMRTSAAIIIAFARTLGHFTGRSRPCFGLNHASRSLSSVHGNRTLDLTAASVPTLTVTPFCVELGDSSQRGSTVCQANTQQLLDFAQDHLAQLTKFAQSDSAQRLCPRFNSYLNIIYQDNDASTAEDRRAEAAKNDVLRRHRLEEPLATNYFTVGSPSRSTVSTIEALGTGLLCPHRLFMNVVVREDQAPSVVVSGDEGVCGGDMAAVARLVSHFASELANLLVAEK
jgi:ferricrocin synthase